MTNAARPRVSATQAKILADLKRFASGGPVARAHTETVGLRDDIAEAIRRGVPLDAIVQSVAARCEVDRRSAIEGLRQSLDGMGLDLSLPRGHRTKADSLRADLRSIAPVAEPQPTPTAGAKKDAGPAPAAPSAAPAATQAQSQTKATPPRPPQPTPFPEIPRGELTHTERSELAKKWIAEQFGDRHPTQVKPDELTHAAQEWLEKLWDKTAPVNPKTGQPYAFKRFTPDGRLAYDEPCWPPEAVAMENSKSGYHPVHDAAVRETIKRYGLRLIATSERLMEIRDKNGKYCVGGFGQDDAPCLVRSVRETAYAIEEERKHGILY
jgi:hypothetical protein